MRTPLPLVLVLLFSGCAALPPSREVMGNLSQGRAVPLTEVELGSNAALLSEQPLRGELGPGAPVVELAQGRSYYRLFRLTPRQGPLHLRVTSYCSCFGFDKRLAVPVVQVLTKDGEVVKPLLDGYEYSVEGAHGLTPLSETLDVTVSGPEAAYALIAADNSRPNALITRININGLMNLNILSYPVGRFAVRYVSP